MALSKGLLDRLATWDVKTNPKAPLTDKQRDAYMELTSQSSNRPLPITLPIDDQSNNVSQHLSNQSNSSDNEFGQLVQHRVDNFSQFLSWYADIEKKMENDETLPQKEHLSHLQSQRDACQQILNEIKAALDFLEEVQEKYKSVSRKTSGLHEACENLIAEQTRLVGVADSINEKLSIFSQLEKLGTKLNSVSMATSAESLLPILAKLDECFSFLNKHVSVADEPPQYKETGAYLAKYHQCISRITGLIRNHIMSVLQQATQQALPKKETTTAPSQEDVFTLFYGKFRSNAPRVKGLMEQIESRVGLSPEYDQLLIDCHQIYFQQRETLLGPSVSNAISELASTHARDHCTLVRSGCAFLVHLCEDEYQLFFHFFSQPSSLLNGMLEGLCNRLYDILRPLIIHINHLETLAELCSILKVEMLEEHVHNNPDRLATFDSLCQQMLEDVQERLVYRTFIYIRQEILHYHPAAGDLAYPEKLEMMESIAANLRKQQVVKPHFSRQGSSSSIASATSLEVEQITSLAGAAILKTANEPLEESRYLDNGQHDIESPIDAVAFETVPLDSTIVVSSGSNMPMSPADLHGMWYPTVRRTLVCLSKLYRCVDRGTFQGLSQEALVMCVQSLLRASEAITRNKGQLDGQLFMIKHLLILREQIMPFNIDFTIRETGLDFSKIKTAAFSFLQSRSRMFMLNSHNSILQFLLEGTPVPIETYLDSKKEVDSHLKKVCEDFIMSVSTQLLGPLREYVNKVNTLIKMATESGGGKVMVRQQPFAQADKVQTVVAETYRNLKTKKSGIQRSMTLYLANRDSEYILFRPIKLAVQQTFQDLHLLLSEHYTEEDVQIIGAPSMEQINLLLASSSRDVFQSQVSVNQ